MSKPIDIRDIPNNYEELLQYVPQSQYTKNAVTQNRRITKLNSEQALAGMNFQPNLEAVFRIAPSNTTLLNLAECYFSITGNMMRPIDQYENCIPAIKAGPLFLLKSINKISLEIGGVAIHTVMTPALLAKLYESLAVNYNDLQKGILTEDGFAPDTSKAGYFGYSVNNTADQAYYINNAATDGIMGKYARYPTNFTYQVPSSTTVTAPAVTGYTITKTASNASELGYISSEIKPAIATTLISQSSSNQVPSRLPDNYYDHITFNGVTSSINPTANTFKDGLTPINLTLPNQAWTWMFKINLKLKDIFPIETMRPIFGQSVVVRLQFDSKGYTGIIDSFGGSPIIYNFQQFYMNVYQYNINVEMINKLNQIYSKPVVEIIDSVDKQLQSIPSISDNNEVQIFIPLQMQFETEYIAIFMPHNISNNANDGLILGKANHTNGLGGIMIDNKLKNYTEHTPMDYRFMNLNRIQVECDGEILYQRTFNENPYPANSPLPLANSPYQCLVNNWNPSTYSTIPFNDYTNAYELYKNCRCYWDVTEESAMPFNEWLYSAFAIIIPTSPFSRLTTGSQLNITINFGEGISNTASIPTLDTVPTASKTSYINERISQTNETSIKTEVLKQICVVQKYKKALVFNGFNNCSIKTISQSFEQDIQVDTEPENKTSAN